jgi:sortase B
VVFFTDLTRYFASSQAILFHSYNYAHFQGTGWFSLTAKRTISIIQIVLAVLVAAGIAWLVFKVVSYNQAQQVYRDIEKAYANESSGLFNEKPPVDLAALQSEYPDVVAWIAMDDVDVSYPVVQGDDNDFYLYNDPSGNNNIDGSVFLDYRTKSLDTDLYALMYGHNMIDESMFGQLDNYVDEGFYNAGTGSFMVYTPEGSYRYKIFAVNIVDPMDEVYQVGFTNTQVFGAFVRQLKERSMYDTGVDVEGYDHVLTLSTCSDTNRLVLSAKRM